MPDLPESAKERREKRASQLYVFLKEYLLTHPKIVVHMVLPDFSRAIRDEVPRSLDPWERLRASLKHLESEGRIKVQARRRANGAVHDWWNAEITLE